MSSDKSIISVSSGPTQFSSKLNSLLNFLEEINDTSDGITHGTGEREIGGVSSTHMPLICHADTTNSARSTSRVCVDEKKVDKSNKTLSSNPLLNCEKKYIWDDWDEVNKDTFCQENYIWDDDEMAMLDEETKCLWINWEGTTKDEGIPLIIGEILKTEVAAPEKQSKRCPVDARQQLQLLKSMSEEVQTRTAAMKTQLDQKQREVEKLHSVRVKNESEHALKMISVKQEWKQRIEDVNVDHEKAS
jgi:hypothetical protein